MDSLERNSGANSPDRSSTLDARLARLEDEALQLREEIAALQDDLRWLVGEGEREGGWLSRGWVRASLLLSTVGVVAIVSLPYLMHADPVAPARGAVPAAHASPAPPRAPAVRPAAVEATVAREPIPAPARIRDVGVPEPARAVSPMRVLSLSEDQPTAPRPRPARESLVPSTDAAALTTPARDDDSP